MHNQRRVMSRGVLLALACVLAIGIGLYPAMDNASVEAQEPTGTIAPTLTPTLDPNLPANYEIQKVVDAPFPITMDWTPDGRLFYTERFSGQLRVINVDGTLQAEPVWTFPVSTEGERGLLGVAVSPDYETTGYIYVYYTRVAGDGFNVPVNRIVRITEAEGKGGDPIVMIDIPLTTNNLWHQGGNIHFGPDDYLYLAIGEYDQPALAQNVNAIPGKINRFEVVGDTLVPAPGNPFMDSAAFAYGLRNPFDFDFDPYAETFQLFAIDNGPACDDELNRIIMGANYGWRPGFPCDDANPQNPDIYTYPLWHITPTEAPTGVAVYTGSQIPQWQGQVFFCTWLTGKMRRGVLDETRTRFLNVSEVDLQGATCQIDVEDGPDGSLYFVNQRAIYRIVGLN